MNGLDLHLKGHLGLKNLENGLKWLVRTISQKAMDGISPNLHSICILPSFQYLLNMGDLDLYLQGHLGQKYLKFGHLGLISTINCRANFWLQT